MQSYPRVEPEPDISLPKLLVGLAAGAVVLAVVGLPVLPTSLPPLPDETQLELLVRSPTSDQIDGAVSFLTWLVWLLWSWLAVTTALRLAVIAVERVAAGAGWVRSLHVLSDLVTLPAVRRAIDASLAGMILVRVAAASPAAAEPLPRQAYAQVREIEPRRGAWTIRPPGVAAPSPGDIQLAPGDVLYIVEPGDTLQSIGLHFYGDPDAYRVIFTVNRNLPQPDGRTLHDARRIYVGWRLILRQPTQGMDRNGHGRRLYVVRFGDTLTGIAGHELGDPRRWPELFQLNRGKAHLPNGWTLTNPDLIWEDLPLEMPDDDAPVVEPNSDGEEVKQEPAPEGSAAQAAPPVASAAVATPAAGAVPATPPPESAAPTTVPATPPVLVVPTTAPSGEATPHASPTASGTTSPPAVAPAPVVLPEWAARGAAPAAALGLLGLGASWVWRRRWHRARLETDVLIDGGFAQAMGDELAYEAQMAALAEQVLAAAQARGAGVQLLGGDAGRTGAGLLLHAEAGSDATLAELAKDLGSDAHPITLARTDDGDWRWRQGWPLQRPHVIGSQTQCPGVQLVPLGVAGGRRILYAAWPAAGPILVAGTAAAGVYELLVALVLDQARRQDPGALHMVTMAAPTRLDPLLADLPHQRAGFIDPTDANAVVAVLDELRVELDRRLQEPAATGADVLLVVDEWATLPESAGPLLDALARHGAMVGMRVLAATTRVDEESRGSWLDLFSTRLVFSVPTPTASQQLLGDRGDDGAEMLDAVGELLPCLQGRVLPRIRGFRVPPLHVAYLVDDIRTRWAAGGSSEGAVHVPVGDTNDGVADGTLAEVAIRPAPADDGQTVESMSERPAMPDGEQVTPAEPATIDQVAPETRPDVSGDVVEQPPATAAAAGAAQPSLIAAVGVGVGSGAPPAERLGREPAETRVRYRVLGQHTVTLTDGHEIVAHGRAWEVGVAIACLADEASLARLADLIWPNSPEKASFGRIYAALSKIRLVFADVLGAADAERVVVTAAGVCRWNPKLVVVDAHKFMDAVRQGDVAHQKAARAAREHDASGQVAHVAAAIVAYQQARDWYGGELLPGLEDRYGWLDQPVKGVLTLRALYTRTHRAATHRLAELLVATGRHAEAAALYRELLQDPGPPDERYACEQERYEVFTQALYRCAGALGDRRGLEQAREQLAVILRQLDVEARSKERSVPCEATVALYDAIARQLDADAASASAAD